jgi:hypothetical protein
MRIEKKRELVLERAIKLYSTLETEQELISKQLKEAIKSIKLF